MLLLLSLSLFVFKVYHEGSNFNPFKVGVAAEETMKSWKVRFWRGRGVGVDLIPRSDCFEESYVWIIDNYEDFQTTSNLQSIQSNSQNEYSYMNWIKLN